MKTIAELALQGLRGRELTDAIYEDFMTHPERREPTREERQRSWEQFFALMDTFSQEELNDGFMEHRIGSSHLETNGRAANVA